MKGGARSHTADFDSRSSGGGKIILDDVPGSKPCGPASALGGKDPSTNRKDPSSITWAHTANPGEPGAIRSMSGAEVPSRPLPLNAQGPGARDPEGCSGTHMGKQAGRKLASQGAKLTGSPAVSRGHVGPELGQPL